MYTDSTASTLTNFPPDDGTARIVVGVSGSATSQQALRWALRVAGERGCMVHAVNVWSPGTMADFVWHDARRLRWEARSLLRHAIASARTATGSRAVVVAVNRSGPVAPALVDAARDAELLVLGGRQRRRQDGGNRIGAACHTLSGTPIVVVPEEGALLSRHAAVPR
ncbi:universal stress protein [Amycolatopsis aidingensis]|uniref:universal stress protein n=1 Tax=Amycolatopsis aidingensis TaxID=2842453 RepID=UPI001C0BD1BB|nr:universal stress protein [Amycolatopsis aidingensis]